VKSYSKPSLGTSIAVGNGANFAQGDGSAIFFGTDSGVFRVHY
jgi:hypothetical protein